MKTLLNEKLILYCIIILTGVLAANAQTPNNVAQKFLRKPFTFNLPQNHSGKSFHGMHDPFCKQSPPCLKSQTTLGGSNYDHGNKMIQTGDGGFIVCGQTVSSDGDFHVRNGDVGDGFGEAYLAKYNKAFKLEWTKTYGGTGDDGFTDIAQTYDGGYIITGATNSNDGDVSGNHGAYDVWVVKLSSSGNIQWQKCLGGTGFDFGGAVVQTIFGGYAIASGTNSDDGNVSGNHNTDGNFDAWFTVLGSKGNLLVQHCYGGSGFDGFFAMTKSDWGSLILTAQTTSNDGDVIGYHGGQDDWVIKIDLSGQMAWQKTVGGSGDENPASTIATTTDGNIVIDGWSTSTDGDINAQNEPVVSFLTKLNPANGNIVWSKSYADPALRAGKGVFATRDGGTVEVGFVGPSFDASTFDVLISKFDKYGNEEWYKRLGGSDFDAAVNGYELPNGDLNILCESNSLDGDVKGVHPGNTDEWVVKLGRCGNYIADGAGSSNDAITATKNNRTTLSAYPNPVLNSATISFTLQQSQKVSVQIFDMKWKINKNTCGCADAGRCSPTCMECKR